MRTLPRDPHLAALHQALDREQAAEAQAHAEAMALSPDEQVAAGVRWPPLRVDTVEPAWRGARVLLRGRVMLHDGLREGSPVRLLCGGRDGSIDGRLLRSDTFPATADIEIVPEAEPPEEGQDVHVIRRLDPTTWDRYRSALLQADTCESPLRTALLTGDFAPVPDEGAFDLPQLDAAQARAAAAALSAHPLAVIHGPPGTGKTWLLGHILRAAVDQGQSAWALAESNAAVDHLAATARARGLEVVRLGHPARVRPDLHELTVDARLARGPLRVALKALQRDLTRASGHSRAARQERRRLRRQLQALRRQAWGLAVGGAQVIAATFGTLAHVRDRLPPADLAVVDEATQATEPAVWVAVPRTSRLVLVGDPEQLGPVVKDLGNPLEDSALQRVLRGDRSAPMLEVQHRMSAAVQRLVSPVYGPQYRPHPSVAQADLCSVFGVASSSLTTRGHLWIDTAGTGAEEQRDPVSRSLANPGEAKLVAHVAAQLQAAGLSPDQLAVITPYSAQVGLLRQQAALAGVEVASVNAFQGRERPVVLMSWVRSSPDGHVGFVADNRRLTVAWSRARCLLVQVGDLGTLSRLPRFADAADRLTDSGDMVSAWDLPWANVLDLL